LISSDQRVGAGAEDGAERRRDQVDPERVELARYDGWPEAAGRVHRGARDRAAEEHVETNGRTDRDSCRLPYRAAIGRHGGYDEHQEKSQDELGTESLGLGVGWQRRPEVRDVAEKAPQQRRSNDSAGKLGQPVGDDFAQLEVAEKGEGKRYRRVEVGAGDVPQSVDQDHDDEAVGGSDALV
jgi:hypothetical protein